MLNFVIAAALIAGSGAAWAAPTVVYVPPPGATRKPAATPVPRDLLAKHDAAFLPYLECGFALSREAHRTGQSVAEFARTWAKSCRAEELEWTRNHIALLNFRRNPNPRATAELRARESRARTLEQYRRFKEINENFRKECGLDLRLCRD